MTLALNKKKEQVVGARKAAKGILGSLDRRLVEPAIILVRFSGWMLLAFVFYLYFFDMFHENELPGIGLWLIAYAGYLGLLEVIRVRWSQFYDSSWFRLVRILFNLIIVTILVGLSSTGRYLLAIAFAVPIVATIVYFAERNWVKWLVFLLAMLGLYLGSMMFTASPLTLLQFFVVVIPIATVSYSFEMLRRRVNLVPGRLTEVARELHKTLDLQRLMLEIMEKAVDLTQAQRGLIIIVDPRTRRYVGHLLHNFNLRSNSSIEDLSRKCFVLVHGRPFECADMVAEFSEHSIYHQFFDSQPQSIIAEPLFNRAGQVMGVINMGHNGTNGFDPISRTLLREFAFLVSSAIENCLEHRQVKLREAKGKEVGGKFVSSSSEDEVVHTLIEEVRQQVPHIEKLTLHRYQPRNKGLAPICSFSSESTPRFFVWSNQAATQKKSELRLGHGIAGRALEARDTISVPDVEDHPWYVRLTEEINYRSLIVAPLFDPVDDELYGTLSLESSGPSTFNLDDETILTDLTTQASLAIAKIRDFQGWREEGSVLRKILEKIRSFDTTSSEEVLCQQISDAATSLLDFKVARIRILSRDNELITTAISGVSERARKKALGASFSFSKLSPFLKPEHKAGNSYLIRHATPGWKQLVDKHFYKPRSSSRKKSGWDAYDALLTPLLDPSGNILGILSLDIPENGSEPNKQTLELIGVFADAAGWVIELGRFQKRLADQQNRTQSFIDTISQELAKGRDINTICEVVVQVGAKLLNAEGCSLYFVQGNQVALKNSNFLAQTDFMLRHKPISTQPRAGLTAWVAATGEVLCFNREEYKKHIAWAGEEKHLQYLPSRQCQSVLLAPVKDKEGKVIGVLSLENKRTLSGLKDFDEKDKELLIGLANEFAKALETIGLYEDIKEWERTGLAEDLHDLINWYHSGVIMWIEAIEEWLKKDNRAKVWELVPQLRRHAYTTIYELKTLHTNVLSKSFEAGTFRDALTETLSVWSNRAMPKYERRMDITFECPKNLEVPVKLRNTIIRIALLAFSNAVQHSGIIEDPGVAIQVRVEQNERGITLAVIDNGKGIDRENTPPGYGLDRMEQLSQKINTWGEMSADLEIRTEVNQGTHIVLNLQPKV